MLHFFRKIRQRLLTDNKFSKYLLYAVGEILLVVIGILIALQIDNWNEERKNKTVLTTYYNQLLKDFNDDQVLIQELSKKLESNIVKYNAYLNEIEMKGYSADLSRLSWDAAPVQFNTNTIKTLQSTGEIKLLPQIIRNNVTGLKSLQEVAKGNYDYRLEGYANRVDNGDRFTGGVDAVQRNSKHQDFQAYYADEKRKIEVTLAYQSAQQLKNVAEKDMLESFNEIQEKIDELVRLISAEMKK